MIYLYTLTPDEWTHEICGVYGRPVHTSEFKKLLAEGWARKPEDLEVVEDAKEDDSQAEAKEAAQEESVLSRDELAESLGIDLHDEDGKKLHYKLIDSAIKEAQSNGEHKEG